MTRVQLYLRETDRETADDVRGPVTIYHKRLSTLVLVGSSNSPKDGLIDFGSPLTIIPERIWQARQNDIEWFSSPASHQLKDWCSTISGVTGGSIRCQLGRVHLTVFDLKRIYLRPVSVVAKFASDNGLLGHRIILGLSGGVLENRRFMLDSVAGQAWLEE